jgi:thiopurine S-methyltransferase
MEPEFWRDRWDSGRIGFHLAKPNPRLVEHWKDVAAPSIRRVLVPLCGKSLDLAYLADQGLEVVGVELVEAAAQAFFAERGVVPDVTTVGPFTRYASGPIAILVGDFFEATAERLGGVFDAAFDRAALIALPPEMRARYVATLRSLLRPHAPILLVLLDHGTPSGPPFAIREEEARALHADARVECLGRVDAGAEEAARFGTNRVEEITLRVAY